MDMQAVHGAHHDKRARLSHSIDRDHTTSPPYAVEGLIDLLSAPGEPDLKAVEIAMQALDVGAEAFGEAVCEDSVAYVRTLLYRDDRAEMLLITWLNGQRSPVHDHGESACLMRVVSGVATENLYRPREGGAEKRAHMSRDLRAGVVTLVPGPAIHSIGNNAEGEALVTLHVYSPSLNAR